MISNGSQLQVTDNSGAKVAQCINQSGKAWGIGDVITVSIKKAQPRSKVSAGQVSAFGVFLVTSCHPLGASNEREKGAEREGERRKERRRPDLQTFDGDVFSTSSS